MRGRLWRVLAAATAVVVVVLATMAVALALSLDGAGRLLNRLNTSQEQLAIVTEIQGRVGRLQGAQDGEDAARIATEVSDIIAGYRRSIAVETQHLDGPARDSQIVEVRRAGDLERAFDDLRRTLEQAAGAGAVAASPDMHGRIAAIDSLAEEIIAKERAETQDTIVAMSALRQNMTLLGVLIPAGGALLAALGAWLIGVSIIAPLRQLHQAAERAGRGEMIAPVEVEGFSDFQTLAAAFSHMDRQITAQRSALEDANKGLENQVEARTREIEASHRQLAEIDRTRRHFFSQVAHELRTPVTVMVGEAEVALRDKSANAEELKEALRHVTANGAFLQRRLQDLLALARSEDGRLTMRKSQIDLGALLRQTAALAEPYVRSSGARLVADLPPGGGPSIEGDAMWLQQSLLALIDNAAKFSGGEGAIRFGFGLSENQALITVSDSGHGVGQAELPHLFDTYYQTPEGRIRGGSGLGMSVAKWVVEQHGGKIAATSVPGCGLTVQIELPALS